MRKICVVTGTRAEYGLLRWVMEEIKKDSDLTLQLIVTGMHLSPEFGLTFQEIEFDGFVIDRKVEMLTSSDTSVGITKAIGLGMIGFADSLNELHPDLVVVLGDRFEIFAAVTAAHVACIPVAHLHGGESTEGLIDEAIRHSITKMSHLHFVAAKEYQQRVIQLGEHPERVFLVGGLGVDNIKRLKLLDRAELEDAIDFKFGKKNLLVTFHPVTLEIGSADMQFKELLAALSCLEDTHIIFTLPNADSYGRNLIRLINEFVLVHKNAKSFTSLGQLHYLSCISQVDGVIGNSSSGITEVPSFKKGTINIGDRQLGRLQAGSIINVKPESNLILEGINYLYSPKFQSYLQDVVNPYGDGGACESIVEIIKNYPLSHIQKKIFFNTAFR